MLKDPWAAFVVLAVSLQTPAADRSVAPPENSAPSTPEAAATSPIDDCIQNIPPVGCETVPDRLPGDWTEWPAVTDLRRFVKQRELTSEQLGEAVRRSRCLRAPREWIVDKPFAVWLRCPTWLPDYEILAVPHLPKGKAASATRSSMGDCGNALRAQEDREIYQVVGKLPEGLEEVVFEVLVRPKSSLTLIGFVRKGTAWTGEISLPIHLIEPKPIAPDDARVTTDAVRSAISVGVCAYAGSGGPAAYLHCRFDRPPGILDGVVVETHVELLRNGKVVASEHYADPDETGTPYFFVVDGMIQGRLAEDLLKPKAENEFSLRVHGVDPERASRWCRTSYWSGEFTVPLKGHIDRR